MRSIFSASQFASWVFTHSLDETDFHGHIRSVFIDQPLLWWLDKPLFSPLKKASSWFPITQAAYQPKSTKRDPFTLHIHLSNIQVPFGFGVWEHLSNHSIQHSGIISLPRITVFIRVCYPTRNFAENQLLDSSIDLSSL